jgi:hypothetical protein
MSIASISPSPSGLLLDSTNVVLEDLLHLSVNDADVPIANINLARVSTDCDPLTDDHYKALDVQI